MPDTGETFPGTAGSGNIVSSIFGTWSNENNIKADDGLEAQVSFIIIPAESESLEATNFSFNIPSGATITGIVLKVNRNDGSPFGDSFINDNTVKLTKNGTVGVGDNKAGSPIQFWLGFIQDEVITYGGTTDLWGTTWTPAEINANTFGAYITANTNTFSNNGFVDYMSIQVYYETGFEGKVNSVAAVNIGKVNGVAIANIASISEV